MTLIGARTWGDSLGARGLRVRRHVSFDAAGHLPLPFAVLTLAVVLLGLAGLFVGQLWSSYRLALHEGTRDAENLTVAIAADFDGTFGRAASELRSVAFLLSSGGKALNRSLIDPLLAQKVRDFRALEALQVFDETGALLYGTGSAMPGSWVANSMWFRTLRGRQARELAFSHVFISPSSHKPVIMVALPLNDWDGHFSGAVGALIDLAGFQQTVDGLEIGSHGVIAVRRTDDSTLVLRHPFLANLINTPVQSPIIEGVAAGDKAGSLDLPSPIDAVARRFSFRTLENCPFIVLVGVARSDYLAPWFRQAAVSAVSAATLLVVLAIMAWRMLRHQIRLRLAATMFRSTQEGIVVTDLNGTIVAANPAFSGITGYDESELLGRNPRILKSGRYEGEFYREIFRLVASKGYWQGEIWNRRKSGEIYPQWLTISSVHDDRGKLTNFIGTSVDTTHVKKSEAQLEYWAHHDPLTNLPNRLLLLSRLQHAIQRARRDRNKGAILFIDLDHFKNINDSLGHAAGDQLLQMVAQRYLARLRDTDTLCRMGGDEFVVLLDSMREPEHAAAVAQSLIHELEEPFVLSGGQEVYVGTSIGISVFPDDGEDAGQIISNADAAMYQAKNRGRNTFRFYTEELTTAANARVELEASLRHGLERHEFLLHYQPLVATESRRITGVEALVRWERPGVGLIPPAQFIPLAEETGLIVPLGTEVLAAACAQMKTWIDAGAGLDTLAVNLSAHQFRRPDIHQVIASVLEETGLAAEFLELEITESALMDFDAEAGAKLSVLKRLGVRLSIDDFGTGFSSLAYLKRCPIDKLKIDRSFVRDIPDDAADMQIVAAITALAKSLNLSVLAEGVETEGQLAFLRELKCEAAQGYLFSRPVPASQLLSLLDQASTVPVAAEWETALTTSSPLATVGQSAI